MRRSLERESAEAVDTYALKHPKLKVLTIIRALENIARVLKVELQK